MRSFYDKIRILIFSGLILFFVVSCASESVNIDLPQNHPANPSAQETAFIQPPNPFAAGPEMKSGAAFSTNEKTHTHSQQHQMTQEMDNMSKDSISQPEAGSQKKGHQH